jgi:C4-dicarboxylate-specific signal transduction histidine kinase
MKKIIVNNFRTVAKKTHKQSQNLAYISQAEAHALLLELERKKIQIEMQNEKLLQKEEELESVKKSVFTQSRYAQMGEMIQMIANQWRQPLNTLGLAISNIETKKALSILDEKSLDENITIISQNITFMSDTIDDFKNYFKADAPKELTKIEDVMQSVLKIMGTLLKSNNIELEIQNKSKSALMIHKNSLVQALLNIVGNAKDALVANKVASAKIRVVVDESKDAIKLKLCDNAGGIAEDILNKIGEHYFSSNKVDGTGLGLYISKTIIEKHFSGDFSWHSEASGACFEIILYK